MTDTRDLHALLEALRATVEAATPGEWRTRQIGGPFGSHLISRRDDAYSHVDMEAPLGTMRGDGSNAALVVALRNIAPAMIEALEWAAMLTVCAYRSDSGSDPIYCDRRRAKGGQGCDQCELRHRMDALLLALRAAVPR